MPPGLSYHKLIKNSKNPVSIRLSMVHYCLTYDNIYRTAREYNFARKTVRKWLKKYLEKGIKGLSDDSRAPEHIPHKTCSEIERIICDLYDETGYGQDMLQSELMERYQIKPSTSTINRILHDNEKIKKRKKKYKRKQQCAEYRKKLKALEFFQFDVKYLNDIPNLVAPVELARIPKYEYTFRDIISGLTFIAYAWEFNQLNTIRFLRVILEHLKLYNVYFKDCIFQSDNGGEMIGSTHRKDEALITILIEQIYRAKFQTIPTRTPRFNGSVESFHNRIEDEFYDRETIRDEKELLKKSYSFMLRWNYQRKSIYKRRKTPYGIIKEHHNKQIDANICNLKPWILDNKKYQHQLSYLPSLLSGTIVADEAIIHYCKLCLNSGTLKSITCFSPRGGIVETLQ